MKSFADGSTEKLARQCKKFLTNSSKNFDVRKWAAEGLSYLTLDADVKELLCDDSAALESLFDLSLTKDKTVTYGVVTCLVNITNTYDKGEEVSPEMIELAKYAKHHIPEEHEKDKRKFVVARVKKLVNAGMLPALVSLANTDVAILTDTLKEMICRVFLAGVENEEHRGKAVAAGTGKVLLPFTKEGTVNGKRFAAHAIAKLLITQNPVMAFPGQRSLECVKAMKVLLHPECSALQNFEALMALTNLAAMDDTHRRRMIHAKLIYDIESHMFEEHEMIRRAATEVVCNMCINSEYQDLVCQDGNDRLKMLLLLLAEEDEKTRFAAASALAILTSNNADICKKIRTRTESWIEKISMTCVCDNTGLALRGVVCVRNIVANCKLSAEAIVGSDILEILMAYSKVGKDEKLKTVATEALKILADDNFIQPTS